MQFQVTQIEFDFTDDIDDPLTDEYKQSLTVKLLKESGKQMMKMT